MESLIYWALSLLNRLKFCPNYYFTISTCLCPDASTVGSLLSKVLSHSAGAPTAPVSNSDYEAAIEVTTLDYGVSRMLCIFSNDAPLVMISCLFSDRIFVTVV